MPAADPKTDPTAILSLFDQLSDDLGDALAGLDDWGLTGTIPGQYHHDVVADQLMIAPLIDAGFRVLTEESGIVTAPGTNGAEGAGRSGPGSITVVVDPVDGSTNASHGLPWYATSLCAVDAEGPLAAHVVNLATGQRFQAVRGEGVEVDAGLADRSEFGPSGCDTLSDAIVSLSGLPPSHGGWRQFRAYGACALDMCAVAGGLVDAFVDVDGAHGVWDYLGAQLVCSEAGVVLADAQGRDLVVLDPAERRAPIAAATQELLDGLLAMWAGWQ